MTCWTQTSTMTALFQCFSPFSSVATSGSQWEQRSQRSISRGGTPDNFAQAQLELVKNLR